MWGKRRRQIEELRGQLMRREQLLEMWENLICASGVGSRVFADDMHLSVLGLPAEVLAELTDRNYTTIGDLRQAWMQTNKLDFSVLTQKTQDVVLERLSGLGLISRS